MGPNRRAQPIEVRHAVLTADHTLAVDRQRLDPKRLQSVSDRRHAVSPIVATAVEHANANRRRAGR
jgi:hypothetical protein